MFCGKCGTENREGVTFCVKCGADLRRQTPLPADSVNRLKTSPKPGDSLGDMDTSIKPGTEVGNLEVGHMFADRYEVLSEGKRGGMGVVYKCRDRKLNRTVALKVIHPKLLSSEQAIQRFRQEVSISLELLHKNIVRVHNLDEYEGIEFFTMEWVEGKSLREILIERKKENRPFTLEEAYAIISELSEALDHAHNFTIHRDIKPENILISESKDGKQVKLTDFGIAKMLTPAQFTTTSLQMGTPYYMAPEQKTDAAHVDKRADIYATGVVLFELLTLENTIGPELPTELNVDLPKEIDSIYRKAVATKPDARYGEINELAEALRDVVQIERKRLDEERERVEELRRQEDERLRREAEGAERRRKEEERRKREEEEQKRKIGSLLDEGKVLLNNNKFDGAIEAFEKVLRIDARNEECRDLLDRAKAEKEKFEQSKREEEDRKRIEEELKKQEEERLRKEAEEQKRKEDARERALWLVERGRESEKVGNYREALNYYREARKKSDDVSVFSLIEEVEKKINEEEEEKKRQEAERKRRERNKFVFVVSGTLLGLIILIYFGFRNSEIPFLTPDPIPIEQPPTPGVAPKPEPKPTVSTPKPSGTYTDPVTGMKFVFVKGGSFQMGDTFGDGSPNERPVHEVVVRDFYIGKFEVTQGQWEKVMGSNPSHFKRGGNYPVESVSWNDVQEFIQKLNQRTGNNYRLPTEGEWEYAARSGDEEEKWAGTSSESELAEYGWYDKNAGGSTHPFGQKKPNGLGLYDMTGNVWEWCQDLYDENYYRNSPRDNPKGPDSGQYRVLRGGSWGNSPWGMRASNRIWDERTDRNNDNGFRLVFSSH
jgi:sulfatase modifying factor 1